MQQLFSTVIDQELLMVHKVSTTNPLTLVRLAGQDCSKVYNELQKEDKDVGYAVALLVRAKMQIEDALKELDKG